MFPDADIGIYRSKLPAADAERTSKTRKRRVAGLPTRPKVIFRSPENNHN